MLGNILYSTPTQVVNQEGALGFAGFTSGADSGNGLVALAEEATDAEGDVVHTTAASQALIVSTDTTTSILQIEVNGATAVLGVDPASAGDNVDLADLLADLQSQLDASQLAGSVLLALDGERIRVTTAATGTATGMFVFGYGRIDQYVALRFADGTEYGLAADQQYFNGALGFQSSFSQGTDRSYLVSLIPLAGWTPTIGATPTPHGPIGVQPLLFDVQGQIVDGIDFGSFQVAGLDLGDDRIVNEGDVVTIAPVVVDPLGREGNPFAYLWQATSDNGQVVAESTGTTFSFTPYDNGACTVRLFLTDLDSGLAAYPDEIVVTSVNVAPALDAGADRDIDEGEPLEISVPFSDAGINDSHSALIDWGDGTFTELPSLAQAMGAGTIEASHAYADNGSYTVTVTVTDDDLGAATDSFLVLVSNVAPAVDAGQDRSADEGALVELTEKDGFTVSFFDAGTADTHSASIDWGDGTMQAGLLDGTLVLGSHVYADNDTYVVTITVTDDDGGEHSDSFEITVLNVAPGLRPIEGQSALEGELIELKDLLFFDAGTLDTHEGMVDWGDGSAPAALVIDSKPYGPPGSLEGLLGTLHGSHVYADDGEYEAIVTVTDDDGESSSVGVNVTVLNVAPTVEAGGDLAAFEGDAVLVLATFTDPSILDSHMAQIDWGDGVITAGVVDALTRTVSGLHEYADNGVYLVKVTVSDDDGDSGSDSLTVSVANVAPVVTTGDPLVVDRDVALDLPPTFFTDAGSADTHSATVDFGDGTIVAGTIDVETGRISASHAYSDNGEFTITVAVTDDDGDVGTGTWLVTVDSAATPLSDFDGDGKSDILWRSTVTGENYLFPMNGTAVGAGESFLRPVADLNWDVAGVGDFNRDGRADLLWRNSASGENYIYFMDGTAIVDEGSIRLVADQNWQVAGVGDFDGDGSSDLYWRNSVTGENHIYFMDGVTIAAEGSFRAVTDFNWRVAGIGDFDGDGNDDILWRNFANGENYLYPMIGTTIGAGEGSLRPVADLNWNVAGVGDFDGNGRSDILWRNGASGDNYVYLMDGTAITGEGFIRLVADLDWRVAALGDYDGDGMTDILWRHAVTGENYLYPMDGLTIKSSEGYVRQVGVDWRVVFGSPWPVEVGSMLAGTENLRLASGDEASTLVEDTDAALMLTAAAGATAEVELVPAPEQGAVGAWESIVELPASVPQEDARGLIDEPEAYAFRLFGHTGATPALFSTEGVALDADGRRTMARAVEARVAQRLDGWVREGDENDRDARRDKGKGGKVEWGASLRSLGAALPSGKSGARDFSHANFAEFEKPKSKSGR